MDGIKFILLTIMCCLEVSTGVTKQRSTVQKEKSTDEEYDDSPGIIHYYETPVNLSVTPVNVTIFKPPDGERLPFTRDTIAPEWIIERMSQLQTAVVKLRRNFEFLMKENAEFRSRWIEVHVPELYPCITRTYVDLVSDDIREYPRGLIMTIKNIKETYIASREKQIPIYELNEFIWHNTENNINGLLPAIDEHRKVLNELLIHKEATQALSAKILCSIPDHDRHSREDSGVIPDPNYVFDEDYEVLDYSEL